MSNATNLLKRFFITDNTGRLVTSIGSGDDIQFVRDRADSKILPCLRKVPVSSLAERNSKIIIDHLAFSFPFSSLKNLERGGSAASKQFGWPKMPKWKDYEGKFLAQGKISAHDKALQVFNQDSADSLFMRLESFTRNVLGLRLGGSRDKGFNGYTNSYRLLDLTGRIELGFVGLGGNNHTVYFQISGQGCKHVFSHTSPFVLHFWLAKVLQITHLTRADLAHDDFDGNFDCEYAIKAYHDDAFKGSLGGPMPKMTPCPEYQGRELVGYLVKVGSRKSNTYWRIYDKAAEQKLKGQVWFRSEVELKQCKIELLENPAKAFAGLNRFSASMNLENGFSVRSAVRRATLDMASRIRWAKQQCGRTLSDICEHFGGDVFAAFGAVLDERGGKFSLPDTQSTLITDYLRIYQNEI